MAQINKDGVKQVADLLIDQKPKVSPAVRDPETSKDPDTILDESKTDPEKDQAAGQAGNKTAADPKPWWHDKLDKYDRPFDPDLHVTDAKGDPVIGKKYGTIKIKPGMVPSKIKAKKAGAFKDVPDSDDQAGDQAGAADPAAGEEQAAGAYFTREMGAALLTTCTFSAYGILFGAGADKPQKYGDVSEAEIYEGIYLEQLKNSNAPELTANQTLLLMFLLSAATRLRGNDKAQVTFKKVFLFAWKKLRALGRGMLGLLKRK